MVATRQSCLLLLQGSGGRDGWTFLMQFSAEIFMPGRAGLTNPGGSVCRLIDGMKRLAYGCQANQLEHLINSHDVCCHCDAGDEVLHRDVVYLEDHQCVGGCGPCTVYKLEVGTCSHSTRKAQSWTPAMLVISELMSEALLPTPHD